MSFEPVVDPLLSTLGKVAYDGILKLTDTKIITNRGLTFYHRDCELEFFFLFSLGKTRTKLNTILQKVGIIKEKLLTFENVISIHGHGMECNEDLVILGVILSSNNTAKIDLGKFSRDIKSNTVTIKIRVRANDQLKQTLVSQRIEKTSQHTGRSIETHIEIALDYADLWYKIFDQYVVRDIDFIFTLNVDIQTILDQIPKKQAKKIVKAAESAVSGNADAIKFLQIMTNKFLLFESDMMTRPLFNSVSVSPDNFFVREIYPTMQSMEILGTGYPVILPGKMRLRVGCVLEGEQITAHGKLIIDLEKFSEVLRAITKDIQMSTLKLKF